MSASSITKFLGPVAIAIIVITVIVLASNKSAVSDNATPPPEQGDVHSHVDGQTHDHGDGHHHSH